MPEENSIFMKTSSRALGILTQLHSETAQAMYAYTVGRQQGANEMALSNAILAERLIGCYRVIPSLLGSPHARKNIEHIMQDEIPVEVGFTEDGWFSLRIPRLLPRKERGKGSVEYIRGFLGPAMQRFFNEGSPVRFDDCVIIYRHIYDREEPERRHRDHDNIETNFVTDIVALYLFVFISGQRHHPIESFHRWDKRNRTGNSRYLFPGTNRFCPECRWAESQH